MATATHRRSEAAETRGEDDGNTRRSITRDDVVRSSLSSQIKSRQTTARATPYVAGVCTGTYTLPAELFALIGDRNPLLSERRESVDGALRVRSLADIEGAPSPLREDSAL
ncbi:hypothetical protein HPB47_027732 [Ixodes persulcatus]|uniref:Uncharacterized protein n=1 Tax=Ixodes persulcatus TaxID=34615 RepID=A0AC60PVP4_IXOPE|nr:hypothetical protein HPB47_027732 [Ixodes persulcatus]